MKLEAKRSLTPCREKNQRKEDDLEENEVANRRFDEMADAGEGRSLRDGTQ